MGLGMEIAVPVAVMALGGHWVDRWLGSEPWFLLVGAMLGIVTVFYILFRKVLPRSGGGPGRNTDGGGAS